jgi:hypothetical protein
MHDRRVCGGDGAPVDTPVEDASFPPSSLDPAALAPESLLDGSPSDTIIPVSSSW